MNMQPFINLFFQPLSIINLFFFNFVSILADNDIIAKTKIWSLVNLFERKCLLLSNKIFNKSNGPTANIRKLPVIVLDVNSVRYNFY